MTDFLDYANTKLDTPDEKPKTPAAPESAGDAFLDFANSRLPDNEALRQSLTQAASANPQEEAKKQRLARGLGVPPDLLMPDAESEMFLKLHPADAIAAKAPAAAKLLEDGQKAGLFKAEIPALQDLDNLFTGLTPAKVGGAALGGLVRNVNVPAFGIARAISDVLPLPEQVSEYFAEKQKQAALVAGTVEPDTAKAGAYEKGAYQGVGSAAGMVPALVGGVYAAAGKGALAISNWVTNAMAGATAGSEYGTARDAGEGTFKSMVYALAQGGVEKVTEMLPELTILKGVTGETGLLKAAGNFFVQDIGGEQVATIWQDFNQWVVLNPTKTIDEFMAERPEAAKETFAATLVAGGLQVGGMGGLRAIHEHRTAKAQKAEGDMEKLKRISKIAGESQVRKDDPESFHEAIAQMSDATDLREIYIDADTLSQAFAKEGGQELLQKMPQVAAQMGEALATKGDVRVSVADYATHIAGSEFDAAVLPKIRTSEGGMTFDESKVFFQTQKEEMAAQAEEISAAQEPVLSREEFDAMQATVPQDRRAKTERRMRTSEQDFMPVATQDYSDALDNANSLLAQGKEIIEGKQRGADRRGVDRRQNDATRKQLQDMKDAGAYSDAQVEKLLELARTRPVDEMNARAAAKEKLLLEPDSPDRGRIEAEIAAYDAVIAKHAAAFEEAAKETPAQKRAKVKLPKKGINVPKPGMVYEDYLKAHPNQRAVQAVEVQKVHDAILKGFAATKRYTKAVVELNVIAIREFYVRQAARAGMSPFALYQKFPVNFGAVGTGGFEQLDGLPDTVIVDGAPVKFSEFQPARDAAREYMAKAGLPYVPVRKYVKVDRARAERIAAEFEKMKHDPENPEVKAAYEALAKEALAQWEVIKATGFKAEFITGEDPYGNPRNAIKDIVENNHMWVYPTDAGYGADRNVSQDGTNHPMLAVVPGEEISGRPVRVNDIFRIVHDYFGHAKEGVGFRADGEENAWRIHSAMFSPLARRALTTETRGQNSWLNFGPHGEANRKAKTAETVFAEQKAGLMPEWVSNEGVSDGVSVIGVHFSKEKRDVLQGDKYGTGIAGAEAKRLKFADDKRIKTRIAFYVDEGQGIFPEQGVGTARHEVALDNLYDGAKNPLGLPSADKNEFESAVLNAGFAGYYVRAGFTKQGVAVLLGDAAKAVTVPGEYAQLDNTTDAFKTWFGDSKVVDENGEPLVLYHGTTHDIPAFDTAKVSPEGDMGAGFYFTTSTEDASINYAGEGPDLTNKIEHLAERLQQEAEDTDTELDMDEARAKAREVLSGKAPNIMPVFLSIKNPVVIGEGTQKPTWIDLNIDFDDDTGAESGPGIELLNILNTIASEFDETDAQQVFNDLTNFDSESIRAEDFVRIIKHSEGAQYANKEDGKLASGEFVRRVLEELGYDGIIDYTVGEKFKAMEGVYHDTQHIIAFKPTQVKSAVGNRGTFDSNDPNVLHQSADDVSALGFYSALARGVASTDRKRGTADAWKAAIKKMANVKKEEIEASGIFDFLDVRAAQGDTEIPQALLESYLDNNGLELEEVIREVDNIDESALSEKADELRDEWFEDAESRFRDYFQSSLDQNITEATTEDEEARAVYTVSSRISTDSYDTEAEAQKAIDEAVKEEEDKAWEYRSDNLDAPDFEEQAREELGADAHTDDAMSDDQLKDYDVFAGEGTNQKVIKLMLPNNPGDTFSGSHWAEGNIVGHVRVSNGPDGKLLVSEMQSDWAQEGRREGFAAQPGSAAEIEAAGKVADAAVVAHDRAVEYYRSFEAKIIAVIPQPRGRDQAIAEQLTALGHGELAVDFLDARKDRDEKNAARTAAVAAHRALETGGSGTPTAPFVRDTKAWTALVLKRVLRYAAENGYKSIVFPTGKMQVELYSGALQKRVDTIEWTKTDKGVQLLGYKNNGKVLDTTEKETALSDAIGKTMADQILSDPAQFGTIRGDAITISDTGMAGYYDKIVPSVVNKISKSLGGGELVKKPLRAFVPSAVEYAAQNLHVEQHFPEVGDVTYRLTGPMGWAPLAQGFTTEEEARAAIPRVLEEQTAKLRAAYDADAKAKAGEGLLTLELTPALRDKIMLGLPLFQQQRGSFNPATLAISFTGAADLSTPLHETGHLYLELLTGMANQADAPQEIKDDVAKVMNWFGVTIDQWNAMSLEEKRPHHEQWAESYERYLLEGKAPSVELRPVFARFTQWLTRVYKSVKDFVDTHPAAGKLNKEIRGVFDRMLASAEAIDAVQTLRGYEPLLPSAKEARLSEEDFANYLKIGEQATAEAVADMEQRSLGDMKWLSGAKSRALKELQAKANSQRAAVRAEVEAQVLAEPIYQAITQLRAKDSEIKLYTTELKAMLPDLNVSLLRGMTSTENGTHPDQVAQMFGLSSGETLINEILAAEDMTAKIDGITDQRMLEEHGELIDTRAVEAAANAAVHNEARAKFLATGLKILEMKGKADSGISATALAKAAKAAAESAIDGKRVRDIRPAQYEAAESRANKEAIKLAAKKPLEAIAAQRASLLNNRLAKAAHDAQSEVEKALRYLKKFTGEGTRKNLDLEYLEQIDAMMAPFNLSVGLTLTEIERRKTLADWIAKQEAMGFEPAIDADQVELSKRKSYKDMTMEELRGFVDAVKQVEHLGRLKKKLLTAKDAREFAARVDEASASIIDNANRTVKERGTPSDIAGMVGQWFRTMAASHRKFASVIREMDGGHGNGVMANLLLYTMNDAGNKEVEMRAKAAQDMARLFEPVLTTVGKDGRVVARKRPINGTSISMTNEQRLMFALNWGNEGNRQRLLDGGITGYKSLSQNEAQRILDTLDKKEWDFVQSVWDHLDTYRPMIAAQERALTGVEPEWVPPSAIITKHGTYKGGYFPAKYDAMLSTRSESLEAATNLRQAMKGAFNASATRKGYTQKRADEVHGRPLLLSFNAISQHVSEVTHRLAWQEWVTDANRVLRALDGTVRETYGPEILKALRDTVKDIAEGDAPANGPVERAINHIRIGSTVVGMGWRVTTALLQPSGLAQSWARIGGRHIARGVKDFMASPLKKGDWVNEKSTFMRERGRTMQREINEVLNVVRAGEKTTAVKASYFMMIAKMQRMVDMPTWLGAYEKALEELQYERSVDENERSEIENQAVKLADQAVLDSQGGGQLKDLSGVQRGSPALKLFTNFYSYFNVTYNMNVEAFRRTRFTDPSAVGALAVDMALLNTVPVLFSMALKEMLKGDCEWDTECLAKRLGTEQLNYMFGQMILLREAGTAVSAATGDGYGYTGPAGLRFFADLYKLGQQAGQQEADLAMFKAANSVGGALLHYPAGQVNSTVEGIMAIENGDVEGVNIFSALIAGKQK